MTTPDSPALWKQVGPLLLILLGLPALACILGICLLPRAYVSRGTPPNRAECKNNLKQIGLALHTYHDKYGSFPPAFVTDRSGEPMHSWRVLVLPFLDQQELYDQYDFTKPWNAPENEYVLKHMPDVFRCPSDGDIADNATSYAAVFGPGCIFDPERPIRIRDVRDGTTNTLLVGEVRDVEIPWTKPEDIDVSQHPALNQPGGFGSHHEGGCQFAIADGAVRFVADTIPLEKLQSLFLRHDGKVIADPWGGE